MERERLISRFDLYALPFFLGLAVLTVFALWPWKLWVVIGFMLLGMGIGGVRLYMIWEHHRVDILAKRNRAMVVHEGPSGFGFIHNGQVHSVGAGDALAALPPPPPPTKVPAIEAEFKEDPELPEYPVDFNELMAKGFIAPGADFVLGFNIQTGEPVRLPTLTSMGISGMPGFGKTVTTLLILMQAIAKYNGKIKFLVSDPHMYVDGDESLASKIEPLRPFFLTIEDIRRTVPADDYEYHQLLTRLSSLSNPCSGGQDLLAWQQVVEMEMTRRMNGKKGDMWVTVIDEFIEVMDNPTAAKVVGKMLSKLNQQARKMRMFSLLISQDWKASMVGGNTDIRNSIATFLVHNTAESVANMILPASEAAKSLTLDIGEALIRVRGKTTHAKIPYTTQDDAETFVELYGPSQTAPVSDVSCYPTAVIEPEPDQPTSILVLLPDDFTFQETMDIQEAYISGLNETDIAKKVYGVKSGPQLAEAKIRVTACIKWMIQQADVGRRT